MLPPKEITFRLSWKLDGPIGEMAYQAYGDSVGWVNYHGAPMPEWGDLPEAIRAAWTAAAEAIVGHVLLTWNSRQKSSEIP